jgi:hypothetical protein
MTTSAPKNQTDLDTQLASAHDRITEIECALGDAVLDGKDATKLQAALDAVRAEENQLKSAIDAAHRRRAERDAQSMVDARREERVQIYRSIVAWLPHVEGYVRARVALDEAEATLRDNVPHGQVVALKSGFLTFADNRVGDLDKRLVTGLPKVPRKGNTAPLPDPERFTPERIAELLARAMELAEAEERGEDIAVTAEEERRRTTRRRKIAAKEARNG